MPNIGSDFLSVCSREREFSRRVEIAKQAPQWSLDSSHLVELGATMIESHLCTDWAVACMTGEGTLRKSDIDLREIQKRGVISASALVDSVSLAVLRLVWSDSIC